MKQSKFDDACPKLEESDRIDPAVGTLLYLGECFERVGRTASAWATFREAASLATTSNQADRARVASSRAESLEPKLNRLSVELSAEAAKVQGLMVRRGGSRLEASSFGTPLPVDPGDYLIEVTAPGYEPWSTLVKIEAGGGNASVRVPALTKSREPLGVADSAPPPAAPAGAEVSPVTPSPPVTSGARRGLSGQQTVGLAVGGVGVVGLALGSVFGVRAIVKNSDAEPLCSGAGLCSARGLELTNQAKNQARLSNIAFAAGGALVAAGAVLFLTGGRRDSDRVALYPHVSPDGAGANILGRF